MEHRYEFTNRDAHNRPSPPILTRQGALLVMEVRSPLSEVPLDPIRGLGAIDTGATITAIDQRVFATMALPSVESVTVSTPSGLRVLQTYHVLVRLPQINLELDLENVAAVDLSGSRIVLDGTEQDIIALIGRDILERCVFVYDGPGATFSLSVPEEIS